MKELVGRRDVMTARAFLYTLRRARFGNPSKDWWDVAASEKVEKVAAALSDPNDEERKEIKRILSELEVESVLDAGCGTCTEYLSYKNNGPLKDIRYVGLDRSRRMLGIARNRFPDVNLVRGDVEDSPFADSSFDAVVIRHVLEHQPYGYEATVLEALRVARKCVIVDFFLPPLGFINFDIKLNDKDGVSYNWYSRKKFEKFLRGQNVLFSASDSTNAAGHKALIYAIEKTRLV